MSKNNSSFGKDNVLRVLAEPTGSVFFVGVGGVSMSALCALSARFGIRCAGVDRRRCEYTDALARCGADIEIGEGGHLPPDTKLVVYSLAADEKGAALLEAERRGIPTVSRAEYMSALIEPYGKRIAVSGTHGKSTVTAMLHRIFTVAGRNPTTLSGAALSRGGSQLSVGSLDYLIYESCEYKDSFLCHEPSVALFLNLEYDHADYFKSKDALAESFGKAIKKAELPIINTDDGELSRIVTAGGVSHIGVGTGKNNTYSYAATSCAAGALRFSLSRGGRVLGEIRLPMLGAFNISNAAMAVAASLECGIPFSACQSALSDFRGISGRLEYAGSYKGRAVYLDYAHHPTEIKAGIEALKSDTGGEITVIFGPHTYSRTAALWDGFCSSLTLAEHVLLCEIDGVREAPIEGVNAAALAREIGAEAIGEAGRVRELVDKTRGTIVIMGAIDMSDIKKELLGE